MAYIAIRDRALATLASLSKLSRASTSVETRFDTILRISIPKATASLSMARDLTSEALAASCFASAIVFFTTSAYSGMVLALSNRLGLVVASRG